MNEESIAIRVKNLKKTFILPTERRDTLKENLLHAFRGGLNYRNFAALGNINLDIQRGEFVGIIGKNGSGKSTLLKIIAGIYVPTEGEVKVNGTIAPFLELGIGFQPELTARENIKINGTLLGMSSEQIKQRFNEIVDFAEIRDFLDLKVKNYSSGMRARLAFSIAKESDADIYLCDEVLAVGDITFQQKCINVFKQWHSDGKTIVFVSHNSQLVGDLCQRVIHIEDGKVANQGHPESVIAAYSTQ